MNRHDLGRFCTYSLESAAKRYKTLGFSIIPLQGARNPHQPKLPAIRWARYQHTIATDEELDDWFGTNPQAGIGIVCGRVSRLMVLDFDEMAVASEFRHLCPQLADTLVIRSGMRGLPHFYYRLAAGKVIPTSAYDGVDLRGEGSYVVAPPTRVGKAEWVVEYDVPIREVSELDLRILMGFLSRYKRAVSKANVEPEKPQPIVEVSEFRRLTGGKELVDYYREHSGSGRNQALFQTAVLARDMGLPEVSCCVLLAPVHASTQGTHYEPYGVRYAEAIRTIASAYSRPARVKKASVVTGLGNAVREWLLSHGLACVARVLDGLYIAGMKVHQTFTELEVCQNLAELKIGRRSISAALKTIIDGFEVFGFTATPHNPPDDANAAHGSGNLNHSCEMSRGAKRVKNAGRGRPARLYQLLSPDEIAAKIGVRANSSDLLGLEDFENPKAYREALHEKLLGRRPGHYARVWLAQRLGISRWTARRYERARGIEVQPAYVEDKLTWNTAARLPERVAGLSRGVFIEARDGKRYPAIRGLALKLLKQGQMPVLKHQQGNYYAAHTHGVGIPTLQLEPANAPRTVLDSQIDGGAVCGRKLSVGIPTPQRTTAQNDSRPVSDISMSQSKSSDGLDGHPALKSVQSQVSVGIPTLQKAEAQFWLCPDCLNFHVMDKRPEPCARCHSTGGWEILSPTIWRDPMALKCWWQQRYREHQDAKRQQVLIPTTQPQTKLSEAAQALAAKLHTQVPDLSLRNAHKLVSQFSAYLIEKALSIVKTRRGVRSPAGFLITFLKSEGKLSDNNKVGVVVKPKAESAMDWLRRLAKSEYLNFISNVDDILNLNAEPALAAVTD